MYKKVRNLKPDQAAYIAGIVDGEGTITLTRRHKDAYRHLALTISSTEPSMLQWIRDIVEVGQITSKRTYSRKHAPSYTYQIFNQQALDLTSQIYPYLRSYKRGRAKLVLRKYKKLTPRNGKYSENTLEQRGEFIESFFKIKAT